jgi:8-oxo-dGTP diphosphatase
MSKYVKRPKIGIATFIRNDKNEILLMLRNSKVGNNTWGLPGGKLEMYETLEECAAREVKEETNLVVSDLKYLGLTNDMMKDTNNHFITIFFETTVYSGKLKNTEPEKCHEQKWFSLDNLPKNLFSPVENYISNNLYK